MSSNLEESNSYSPKLLDDYTYSAAFRPPFLVDEGFETDLLETYSHLAKDLDLNISINFHYCLFSMYIQLIEHVSVGSVSSTIDIAGDVEDQLKKISERNVSSDKEWVKRIISILDHFSIPKIVSEWEVVLNRSSYDPATAVKMALNDSFELHYGFSLFQL